MPGSETRQRRQLLQIRLNDAEAAQVQEFADRTGLTPASYARDRILTGEVPRPVRRPPVDRVRLAQLLALAGQIAEDLRMLARSPEQLTEMPTNAPTVEACLDALLDLRDAVMAALGRQV